jgi:DhnA family fructose-bisphosphate aldolase class Ia
VFEGFIWVVESAGKTKVVVAGGHKKGIKDLLHQTHEIIQAGASGLAIGRNIWQHKEPLKITKALKSIIFNHKTPEEAKKYL